MLKQMAAALSAIILPTCFGGCVMVEVHDLGEIPLASKEKTAAGPCEAIIAHQRTLNPGRPLQNLPDECRASATTPDRKISSNGGYPVIVAPK